MFIGNSGENVRNIDTAKTSKPHSRRVQSFEEPVRLQERQIYSRRHPGCGGYHYKNKEELVSERDFARWLTFTYAMRLTPLDRRAALRPCCVERFQTTCCEWWITIQASGEWHTRAKNGPSKKIWHMAPLSRTAGWNICVKRHVWRFPAHVCTC